MRTLKILLMAVPLAVIVFVLSRDAIREKQLMREEAAVKQLLAAQPERFQLVTLTRSKNQRNLLSGQVTTKEDIQFLTSELKRLQVRRCIFAVTTDSSTVMDPKIVQQWKKRD